VTVRTVIFDWGGTLTPWHGIDHETLWRDVCVKHYAAARAAEVARALHAAERDVWAGIERSQESATLAHVIERARVSVPDAVPDAVLASYFEAWEPHTITHPDAPVLLRELRRRNIRIGVLSNTLWPRAVHDQIFTRDQVLDLIDGTVYSCELPWTKPHPEAFRAAMAAVGEDDPAVCVFVGDRPFDDVHGAKSIGMRAVLMAGSSVPPFGAAVPDATITRLSQLLPHLDRW
jgi:putative hydrolase of the HAD superfamily